ncbi:MAG: SusC/RagA family TonB-linked outer membrane protein, partial [Alloprevotella sp.]
DGKYWTEENKNLAWIVGQPVQLYTPIWAGVNKKTGAPQWYLPGDDPTKTTKDPSRVTSDYSLALSQATGKNRNPDWTGGFGVRAGWKGFSLVADFSFQLNKYLVNNDAIYTHNIHRFAGYNQSKDLIGNLWTVDNPNAAYPSKNYHTMEFDTRVLENASFMRLKNITLSYMLPKSVLGKTRVLSSASVFVTGRNLITVTNYTGQDPEVNANLTYGGNPNTKQVSVGVNLTF